MPTFDGENLIITLDSGVITLDVQVDLYSDWKEWFKTGTNAKYPLAFRTFGGDPLSASVEAGAYYMFQNQNGWRIRPPEEDITILVNGNIAPEDPTLPIAIPTIGAYTTLLLGIQPITQNVDSIIEEQEKKVTNLQYVIESHRDHHTGTGDLYYWDPVNGLDTNDGETPQTATQTFSKAHDLATDGNHDIIICVPGQVGGDTIADEIITISKRFLFVRAPGRDFRIVPTDTTQPTVTITGDGVEVSNLFVGTAATGSNPAIKIDGSGGQGNFALISNVWIDQPTGVGILVNDSDNSVVRSVNIEGAGSNGVEIDDNVDFFTFEGDTHISGCNGDGICLVGANINEVRLVGHTEVESNSGYGLRIFSGATNTHVHSQKAMFDGNTLGDFLDDGVDTNWGDALFSKRMSKEIINVIEYQRGRHTATGNIFYVDPVNGDTHANGARGSRDRPYSLIQECHDNVVVDSNHDLILITPSSAGGTTITEAVNITKRYLFIRGPGRDLLWTRTGSGHTISITADGVELSGFQINTDTVGAGNAINISGADFCALKHVWVNSTQGDAISISNSSHVIIENSTVLNSGVGGSGHGIQINPAAGASDYIKISNCHLSAIQGHAIWLVGASIQHVLIEENTIHGSTGWGIKIETGVVNTIIKFNILGNNASGAISDAGTNSIIENNQQWLYMDQVVEGTFTLQNIIRLISSVLFGKATATQSPNQVIYRDIEDTKDRVTVLHSDDGDRTSVTKDGT